MCIVLANQSKLQLKIVFIFNTFSMTFLYHNRPTTVHRFIVNETIEENILTLIRSVDDSSTLSTHWDLDNMTLESLKNLFILKEKE